MKSAKGAAFERLFSKQLSRWVSNGERDDIFWRSPGSGGWASRKTSSSQGGGDIVAIDAVGKRLLDKVTIELKCGYNKDFPKCFYLRPSRSILDEFIIQAKNQADKAGTPYWWLVWKLDRVDPLLFCPKGMLPLNETHILYYDSVHMGTLSSVLTTPYMQTMENIP